MNIEEIIIINNEPFYRIPNGTSYDYAPIPKEFKPYFERLQQENKLLEHNWNELKKWLEERYLRVDSGTDFEIALHMTLDKMQSLEDGGNNDN